MRNLSDRLQYKPLWLILLCLIATVSATSAQAAGGTFSVIGQSRWVQVATVFDGDTFRTRKGEKVRLLGINTPEVAHGRQATQAYGIKAKRRLTALIAGQTVQLRLDKDKRDKYGRTLAQVYVRDGRWINDIMVREGLAHVYTFAPNFYWVDALLKSEAVARNDMRGMWKSFRWRVLDAVEIGNRHIGQFRLVRGYVDAVQAWRFKMAKLFISVPRKSRQWFTPADLPKSGQKVVIGGVVRISSTGKLYLSLHSPHDLR